MADPISRIIKETQDRWQREREEEERKRREAQSRSAPLVRLTGETEKPKSTPTVRLTGDTESLPKPLAPKVTDQGNITLEEPGWAIEQERARRDAERAKREQQEQKEREEKQRRQEEERERQRKERERRQLDEQLRKEFKSLDLLGPTADTGPAPISGTGTMTSQGQTQEIAGQVAPPITTGPQERPAGWRESMREGPAGTPQVGPTGWFRPGWEAPSTEGISDFNPLGDMMSQYQPPGESVFDQLGRVPGDALEGWEWAANQLAASDEPLAQSGAGLIQVAVDTLNFYKGTPPEGPASDYAEARGERREGMDEKWLTGTFLEDYQPILDNIGSFIDWKIMAPAIQAANTPFWLERIGDTTHVVTPAEALQPIGQAFNQTFNPFNPNFIYRDPNGEPVTTWRGMEQYPIDWNRLRELTPAEVIEDSDRIYWETRYEWMKLKDWYERMTPEQRSVADVALASVWSGPAVVEATAQEILDYPATLAGLEEEVSTLQAELEPLIQQRQSLNTELQAAERAGDERRARSLRQQLDIVERSIDSRRRTGADAQMRLNKLRTQTVADIIEDRQNIWAEMIGGTIFDPLGGMDFGMATDAIRAWRTRGLFTVPLDKAPQLIEGAVKQADELLQGVAPGAKVDVRTWWETVNPFALSNETRANDATEWLWATANQLMTRAKTKGDALELLTKWTDSPWELFDPAGKWKVGAGMLANKRVLEEMPVLRRAAEQFSEMTSLTGDGPLYIQDLVTELDDLFHKAARSIYGAATFDLPQGATNAKLRRLGDGTGIIDYLDDKGKVIQSTQPKVYYDAQQDYKALKETAKSLPRRAGEFAANTQRAILSDMWLNMRPAHWIRNAASAAMHLAADNIFSWRDLNTITDFWSNKLGGLPTRRLASEGTMEGAIQGRHWADRVPGLAQTYAPIMKRLNWLWTGAAEVKLPGGKSIPFGEHIFRLKGFDNAARKSLEGQWTHVVRNEFQAQMEALGVNGPNARMIANKALEAGITGNRDDLERAIRFWTNLPVHKYTIADLQIPRGLLDPEVWKEANDVLTTLDPSNVEQATAALRSIFWRQIENRARILNSAPQQATVPEWMRSTNLSDMGDFIDNFVTAARRGGADPDNARQQATAIARDAYRNIEEGWTNFRSAIAASPHGDAARVGLDAWAEIRHVQTRGREAIDNLLHSGVTDRERWPQVLDAVGENWRRIQERTNQVFARSRDTIAQLDQGVTYQPRYNAWDTLDEYIQYDRESLERLAQQGIKLRKTDDPRWQSVIDSSRRLVDNAFAELYDAFKLNPTQEAMDMIAATRRTVDTMGAQAAGYLAPLRRAAQEASLAGNTTEAGKAWNRFFRERNKAWESWRENATLYTKSMRQLLSSASVQGEDISWLHWLGRPSREVRPPPTVPSDAPADVLARMVDDVSTPTAQATDDISHRLIGPAGNNEFLVFTNEGIRVMRADDIPEQVMSMYNRLTGGAERILAPVPQMLEGLDFFGLKPGDDLIEFLRGNISASLRQGGSSTGEVAEMLGIDIEELRSAYRRIVGRLPDLAEGMPNQISPSQRQQIEDIAGRLMGRYDDVLRMSVYAGEEATDFAMLNYGKRRNFDAVLSFTYPYHYFWSRTGANWMKRILNKPAIVNWGHEYEKAKRNVENQKKDTALRTEGKLPNPLHDFLRQEFGVQTPRYMDDPLEWMLPHRMYMPNEFIDPEEASSEYGKWLMRAMKLTPGAQPTWQAALFAGLDRVSPREDGRSWLSSYQIGDFVPLVNLAGYGYQYATGKEPPKGFWGWGDEWEPGRIGRGVARDEEAGPIDRLWGQDVLEQKYEGAEPLPEQPADAEDVFRRGVSSAAGERLWAILPRFLFGVGMIDYPDREAELRAISKQRQQLAFNEETQPFGGQDFQRELNEDLYAWWEYPQYYPGSQERSGRPGDVAVRETRRTAKENWDERIGDEMRSFTQANPDATSYEIRQHREQLEEQRDADLKSRFPSYGLTTQQREDLPPVETASTATAPPLPADSPIMTATSPDQEVLRERAEGDIDYWRGMNPSELADSAITNVVWQAREDIERLRPAESDKPVYPGDDATQAQWDKYNEAKAKWDAQWDEYNEAFDLKVQEYLDDPDALSELVGGRDVDLTQRSLGGETARDFIDSVFGEYRDPEERVALGGAYASEEQAREERDAVSAHWDAYRALGDDNNAKAKYMRDNPDFAAYYVERYGEDSAWWEGGEGGSGQWSAHWDAYRGFGEDWDAKAQYMRDNPDFAAYYVDRYGEDSAWWGDAELGKDGEAIETTLTRSEISDHWDAYLDLDNDGKRQYMADNPDFADYYTKRYGEGSDWWNTTSSRRSGPGYDSLGNRAFGSWGGGGGRRVFIPQWPGGIPAVQVGDRSGWMRSGWQPEWIQQRRPNVSDRPALKWAGRSWGGG